MFSSRKGNNIIDGVHERPIRTVSRGNESNFEILSEKNNEITIHQRNVQVLMIEVYKEQMYTLHQSWTPFTYLEKIRN